MSKGEPTRRLLSQDTEGIGTMLIAFALISIIALVVMALAPEYFIVGIIVLFGLAIWFGIVKLGSTEGQTMITRKTVVAGVVILLVSIVLATVILAGWIPFGIIGAPSDFDKDAKTHTSTIDDFTGGGHYPDNGVFSKTQYIMSWLKDGEGQDITIAGKIIVGAGAGHAQICKGQYRLYMTESSSWGDPVKTWNWLKEMSGIVIGGTVNLPSKTYTPTGSYDGWAKVEVWIETQEGFCGNPLGFPESGNIARDYAYLRSGVGKIWFEPSDQVEIGETLKIWYDVGWSSGSGGNWVIILTSLADNEERDRFFPDDDTHNEYFSYVVRVDDFQVADPCPRNALRATLYNALNLKDIIDVTSTDIAGLGPTEPKITLSPEKSYYNAGDEVTITLQSEPNPQGQAPIIKYFIVIAPDGDDFTSSSNTFTYTFSHSGEYEIQAYCQDATCHMSAVAHKTVKIYEPGTEPPITDLFDWSIILILIAGLIGFLVTVLVMKDKGVGTVKSMLGGLIVFIIIIFIALIFTGEIVI